MTQLVLFHYEAGSESNHPQVKEAAGAHCAGVGGIFKGRRKSEGEREYRVEGQAEGEDRRSKQYGREGA